MVDANERVIQAILSLEGNKDFITFVEWLSDNLNDEELTNRVMKDDTLLRWGQGRVQCLASVLDTVINSRKLYNTIRDTRKGPNPM